MRTLQQYPVRKTTGFSLVELLIAMVLGLVVVEGVLQVYMGNRNAYIWVNAHARQQEGLRFAVDTMMDKFRGAAFEGCAGEDTIKFNTLNQSSDFAYDFDTKTIGFAWTGSSWSPAGLPTSIKNSADTGSDVMTFRGVSSNGTSITTPYMGNTSADIHALKDVTLKEGDVVMASDCLHSTVLQVTNVNSQSGSQKISVVHNTGGAQKPGNSTKDLGVIYGAGAEIAKMITESYYVSKLHTDGRYYCSDPSGTDDPDQCKIAGNCLQPALCRAEFEGPGRRIVEGVERMRFLFGEDLDSDKSVDRYVTADQVGTWGGVMAVKIGLLLRSADEIRQFSGPTSFQLAGLAETVPSDQYMRRAITQTVAIRNRLF